MTEPGAAENDSSENTGTFYNSNQQYPDDYDCAVSMEPQQRYHDALRNTSINVHR